MKRVSDGIELDGAVESVLNDIPAANCSQLPVKQDGFWASFKSFWLQEVETENFWFKNITVEPAAPKANGKPRSFLYNRIVLN